MPGRGETNSRRRSVAVPAQPAYTDTAGPPDVLLADALGNNCVTFATLRPVTYRLHSPALNPWS